jgi:hypothetical protein
MMTDHSEVFDPILADPSVAPWLARETETAESVVRDELAEAASRRAFIVDELLEAGYSYSAVLDGTIRLTALSESDATALIRSRALLRPATEE